MWIFDFRKQNKDRVSKVGSPLKAPKAQNFRCILNVFLKKILIDHKQNIQDVLDALKY